MNEHIQLFLKKLAQDEELQKKLADCHSPEEAYQIAQAVQEGFSKEEFIEAMKTLYEQTCQDLNEKDLAQVSGGDSEDVVTGACTAIVSIAVTYTLADTTIITSSAAAAA